MAEIVLLAVISVLLGLDILHTTSELLTLLTTIILLPAGFDSHAFEPIGQPRAVVGTPWPGRTITIAA